MKVTRLRGERVKCRRGRVMFLLPLLVLAMAGFAVYTAIHHRTQPATGAVGVAAAVAVPRTPFWPTTIEGKFAIGAFLLSLLPVVFVNVTLMPYLGPVVLLAAFVVSGVARFAKHDHSTSVLIAVAVSTLAILAGLLFLAGEVFIGHD
jgi:hypothetical protein